MSFSNLEHVLRVVQFSQLFYFNSLERSGQEPLSKIPRIYNPATVLVWSFFLYFFTDSQFATADNTSWFALMKSHMTKIANEKGLDAQNYQCADCASPIGKFIRVHKQYFGFVQVLQAAYLNYK